MNAQELSHKWQGPVTGTKLKTRAGLWVVQERVKLLGPPRGLVSRETQEFHLWGLPFISSHAWTTAFLLPFLIQASSPSGDRTYLYNWLDLGLKVWEGSGSALCNIPASKCHLELYRSSFLPPSKFPQAQDEPSQWFTWPAEGSRAHPKSLPLQTRPNPPLPHPHTSRARGLILFFGIRALEGQNGDRLQRFFCSLFLTFNIGNSLKIKKNYICSQILILYSINVCKCLQVFLNESFQKPQLIVWSWHQLRIDLERLFSNLNMKWVMTFLG